MAHHHALVVSRPCLMRWWQSSLNSSHLLLPGPCSLTAMQLQRCILRTSYWLSSLAHILAEPHLQRDGPYLACPLSPDPNSLLDTGRPVGFPGNAVLSTGRDRFAVLASSGTSWHKGDATTAQGIVVLDTTLFVVSPTQFN